MFCIPTNKTVVVIYFSKPKTRKNHSHDEYKNEHKCTKIYKDIDINETVCGRPLIIAHIAQTIGLHIITITYPSRTYMV